LKSKNEKQANHFDKMLTEQHAECEKMKKTNEELMVLVQQKEQEIALLKQEKNELRKESKQKIMSHFPC